MTARSSGYDPKSWLAQLPSTKYQKAIKNTAVMYRSAVAAVNTSGTWEPASADATLVCYGFVDLADADSITGDGTKEITVSSGCRLLVAGATITAADEGKTVFAVDDATFSLSSNSGARPVMGVLRKFVSSTSGYVEVNPVLNAALAAGTAINTTQAQINVPLGTAILAAGTPMAAFADNASSNPGVTLANSKAVGIRWNNNASQTAVWFCVPMPQDLDDTAALVLHALVSKTGATTGDATTLTVTAFFQTVAALHDADTDCGGTSSAVTGNATAKTVTEITLSIAGSDVPASPSSLSFSIKPTDGTLGTDDFIVHALWFEYTRKPLTA